MRKNNISVDVVIPTFNSGKYILDAIKSIEKQTYPINRLIIIDDGSDDDTEEIVLTHKSKIKIKYFKQPNRGPNSARNKGVNISKAEWIAFLDADDVWAPDKINLQIELIQKSKFKNLGLVYCQYKEFCSEKNRKLTQINASNKIRGFVFNHLLEGNLITGSASSVIIKKEVFAKVGQYDEELKFGEDWDMWLRISQDFEVDFVDKVLVGIRRHDKNTQNDKHFSYVEELKFFNKWASRIENRESLSILRKQLVDKSFATIKTNTCFVNEINNYINQPNRVKFFPRTKGNTRLYFALLLIRDSLIIQRDAIKSIFNNCIKIIKPVRKILIVLFTK